MSLFGKVSNNQFQAGAAIVLSAAAALYYLYRSYSKKNSESTLPDVTHHHPLHPQGDRDNAPVVDASTWSANDKKLLDEDFELAVAFMRSTHSRKLKLDNSTKLRLYGLFKSATVGNCNVPKPGMFDLEGNAKWSAWRELNGLEKYEAKLSYIQVVTAVCPEWHRIATEAGLDEGAANGIEEDISDEALKYDAAADAKRHERARVLREQEKAAEKERLRQRLLTSQRPEETTTEDATEASSDATATPAAPVPDAASGSGSHMGPVFSRVSMEVDEDELQQLRTRAQAQAQAQVQQQDVETPDAMEAATDATTSAGNAAAAAPVTGMARVLVDDDLSELCSLDDVSLVEALVRRHVAKNKIIEDEFGNTLLHHAADAGASTVCQFLVKEGGYDVDIRDASLQTALMSAVMAGQVDCVKALVELGADLSAKEENGSTAVDLAKEYNPEVRDEMLRVLSA